MKGIRDRFITIRFTEEEYVNLGTIMKLEGYNSRSRFVRDRIFITSIRRRNLSQNDANLSKQIELLNAAINKIGINYNQTVKAVNRAVGLRDKEGNPVVTDRLMDFRLTGLKKQMDGILSEIDKLKAAIAD